MDPNNTEQHLEVIRITPYEKKDRHSAPKPIAPLGESTSPIWLKLGASMMVALLCSICTVVAWNLLTGAHWLLALSGVLMGLAWVMPLRAGSIEWKRHWCWRTLPASGLYALLCWVATDEHRDPAPMSLLFFCTTAISLAAAMSSPKEIEKPIEVVRQPAEPPWPPSEWTPEDWSIWWQQLVNWNVYRAEVLHLNVQPLSRPPVDYLTPGVAPADEVKYQWETWFQAYTAWEIACRPVVVAPEGKHQSPKMAIDTTGFPPGWQPQDRSGPIYCKIHGTKADLPPDARVAKCPHCKQPICRTCLSDYGNSCPSCGK